MNHTILKFGIALSLFATTPLMALQCQNDGTPTDIAPNDNGDGGSTACGDSAVALGPQSISIGIFSSSAEFGTALGWLANASGSSSVALGDSAKSPGFQSVGLGILATASGVASAAIGPYAVAEGDHSVVLGSIAGLNEASVSAKVAIGTTTPQSPLHIFRDDTTQELLRLESNEVGVTQDRPMIQLTNNGGIRFQFDNVVQGTAWRFQAATGGQDNFEITKVGTGQIEFKVDADGNAYLAGLLFESSDRNAKTNITPVDPDTVLDKVAQLPIAQWAYKESPQVHHIGPMAQDFRAAFGTGSNDTTLATMDVGGVAIASIQALNQKLETENLSLRHELASLKQEVQELQALMMQLGRRVAQN